VPDRLLKKAGAFVLTQGDPQLCGEAVRATGSEADGLPFVLITVRGRPAVPNVNVTYGEMQSAARQLQAGEQTIEGDLSKLKRLVDNLVAGGYVTDTSSKQFEASYTQFNTGATKMIQGLNGMGQYLDAAVKAFHETDTQLAASLRQ
jgi:WXG100 family type VII secretion target